MYSKNTDKGFTLIEVMIAMAVFFVSITVLIAAYLNTLQAIASVQVNQSLEQDLAMIRQRALVLSDLKDVEAGDDILTGQHGLARWEIEYEPTELADLFLVTLSIQLDPSDDEGTREATQTFYLTRPTWSDPVERSELQARTKDRFLERQGQLQ